MSSIVLDLAKILPAIRRPGDFYATGTMELFAPNLEVDGVGRISLPLLPVQAEQLVAVATRAPYGRGEETVIDTNVRRTWQIDADRIRLGGRHWMQTLDAIVAKASAGLGVTGPVSAELYKLLIYDTGSFFVEHRDTEKAAGMFATLVIAQPDEEHFHEASGNEGVSFERSYRRAAIVLWPKSRRLAVINQAGLSVTLPYLAELTRDWLASGNGPESAPWRDAHTLSTYMLQDWPMHGGYGGAMESEVSMLTCLHQLRDTAQIDAFLSEISGGGCYGGSENEALVRAAMLLPQHRATDLVEKIVVRNAHHAPGACANLLARCCAEMPDALARFNPAATALVETLLGERVATDFDPSDPWRRAAPIDAALLVDLLTALCDLDATALGMRLVEHALSSQKSFPMDAVLVPAALRLTEQMQTREWAPVARLHAECVHHLQTRCAQPLAPPSDFKRPSPITCQCASCAELSRFLSAPDRRVWEFKAAEPLRRHVEDAIRKHHCDLDFVTEKRRRPYSLVCTKNQASYERLARQRKKDIEVLGRLGVVVQ